jgi:hypothetical protein
MKETREGLLCLQRINTRDLEEAQDGPIVS